MSAANSFSFAQPDARLMCSHGYVHASRWRALLCNLNDGAGHNKTEHGEA